MPDILALRPEPAPVNAYLAEHASLLARCYRHWTGRDLLEPAESTANIGQALYHAPFVVLSHAHSADPCFDYANLAAQSLFERPWAEIVGLPSRLSAEPIARAERELLLARVAAHGYIDDYAGVRIARSGRRFRIAQATVWNLISASGQMLGQAACFAHWSDL